MTGVERLFAEYKAAHLRGEEADPRRFLGRVSGAEREQLAALIDAYLERAPRRDFDADALRDSSAAAVSDSVARTLSGAAGLWPVLLPRLRNQARIKRADLVAELAARLGAQSQREKVAAYYHQMEQGRLAAAGVSDTVLDALGKIVGYGKEGLRRAGQLPAVGGQPPEPGAAFARTTRRGEAADETPIPPPAPEEWDEVDRLFRGG